MTETYRGWGAARVGPARAARPVEALSTKGVASCIKGYSSLDPYRALVGRLLASTQLLHQITRKWAPPHIAFGPPLGSWAPDSLGFPLGLLHCFLCLPGPSPPSPPCHVKFSRLNSLDQQFSFLRSRTHSSLHPRAKGTCRC